MVSSGEQLMCVKMLDDCSKIVSVKCVVSVLLRNFICSRYDSSRYDVDTFRCSLRIRCLKHCGSVSRSRPIQLSDICRVDGIGGRSFSTDMLGIDAVRLIAFPNSISDSNFILRFNGANTLVRGLDHLRVIVEKFAQQQLVRQQPALHRLPRQVVLVQFGKQNWFEAQT